MGGVYDFEKKYGQYSTPIADHQNPNNMQQQQVNLKQIAQSPGLNNNNAVVAPGSNNSGPI